MTDTDEYEYDDKCHICKYIRRLLEICEASDMAKVVTLQHLYELHEWNEFFNALPMIVASGTAGFTGKGLKGNDQVD